MRNNLGVAIAESGVTTDSWVDQDYSLVVPIGAEVRCRISRRAIRSLSEYAEATVSIHSAARVYPGHGEATDIGSEKPAST